MTASFMHFAAAGYPPIRAERSIPPELLGIRNIFVNGRKMISKKFAAELLQINTESAISGKSEGMTVYEHMWSPRRIPSLIFAPPKRKIIPTDTARSAVKKLFLFKKIPPFVNMT